MNKGIHTGTGAELYDFTRHDLVFRVYTSNMKVPRIEEMEMEMESRPFRAFYDRSAPSRHAM